MLMVILSERANHDLDYCLHARDRGNLQVHA